MEVGTAYEIELRKAIQTSIIEKWQDAYRRQDAAAIADLFVEDGDFITFQGAGHYAGRIAIKKGALHPQFENGFTSQEIKITKVGPLGNGAYGFGELSASGQSPRTSAPISYTARWTAVYERGSDGWKVRHLATTPLPQAAPR